MRSHNLLPLALLLAACGSTNRHLITSFEDQTSAVHKDTVGHVTQNRVFSLSGSLPQAMPGQIIRYKGGRSISTGYGISDSCSYLMVKEFAAPEDPATKIRAARKAISAAQEKAAAAVAKRFELLTKRNEGQQKDQDQAAFAEEVEGLEADLKKAEVALDEKVEKAAELIQEAGLLVVRWDQKTKEEFKFLGLFNVGSQLEQGSSGYLILAGLRESTLYLGQDVHRLGMQMDDSADYDWGWKPIGWFPWFLEFGPDPDIRLTTRTVMARQLAYLQDTDLVSSIAAKVEGSYKDLTHVKKALKELDKIEIEASFAKVRNLSNQGWLAEPDWYRVDHVLCGHPDHAVQEQALLQKVETRGALDLDDWITVFAVDAELWDLKDLFDDPADDDA